MDFSYGLGMGVLGTSITIIGFFIAYVVAFKNYEKAIHKTIKKHNPMFDLMKDMPGSKQGDDCQ